MARIRTFKPSFFRSRTIQRLAYEQRLTFLGLWTHVDDEGRCEYDPELIKADIWPRDRSVAEVVADLVALNRHSLITHYVVTEPSSSPHGAIRERSLLIVNGFAEHQRVNRPTPSRLPAPRDGEIRPLTCDESGPAEPEAEPHRELVEASVSSHAPVSEASSTTHPRKGRERKGREVPTSSGASRTAEVSEPITAQTVAAAWVDASTANGVTPSRSQIGQVAKLAKELLTANAPDAVLDAAKSAGAKGFASIDRELTVLAARPATLPNGWRELNRDPNTGRAIDW